MERNFTSLGPHVLPVSEMYKVRDFWIVICEVLSKRELFQFTILGMSLDFKNIPYSYCIH